MNKNTIIGITLIGLLLIGFSVYNSKIAREQQEIQRVRDSVAAANAFEYVERAAAQASDSISAEETLPGGNSALGYAAHYANPYLEQWLTMRARSSLSWKTTNLKDQVILQGGPGIPLSLSRISISSEQFRLYLMKKITAVSDFSCIQTSISIQENLPTSRLCPMTQHLSCGCIFLIRHS